MGNICKIKNRKISVSLLSTLLCYMLYVFTHKLYIDVDGYMISTVTNRIFDLDNYCIFLHPWLCWIVGALSDLLKSADALALLEHVLFFIEFVFLFYVSFYSEKNKTTKAVYIFFLISASQIIGCWNANFTVQAAALSGGGIVLLYSGRKKSSIVLKLFGTVFIMFGAMLRIESAIFFIPFVLLDVLFEKFFSDGDRKVLSKDLLRLWTVPVLIFSVLVAIQSVCNSSPKYLQSVEYSRVRAEIVDYQYKAWEEVQSILPDVTKSEYEAVCSWNLSDTENFSVEKLKSIAQHGKSEPFPMTVKGVIDAIQWMILFFRGSTTNVKFMAIVIAVIWILLMSSTLPKWRKIETILAIMGGALIIWYFVFIGRAPFRIWEAVFLAVITLQIIILTDSIDEPHFSKYIEIAGIAVIALSLFLNLKSLDIVYPQLPSSGREYNDSFEYDNDIIYIWNKDPSTSFKEEGKLPTREYLSHNIVEGDWIYGQVYFKNFLELSGIPNPAEALVERDNVLYVSEDCRQMFEYLKDHYYESLQVAQVGIINDFPVWKFY